ncbi:Lrp/AsnC family transcriptional regulator [Lentilitoribacter sp. Alg239-R112]|jgi:DNA-binding Lrp family transcriptional regulator|uniref:Lrp/AsnC family transcriptional regulator n=1 Tax=Lentilitoribacter sp. Alg239-R112 TaxID=2305987 RepID=UPI0013A6E40C|nr:Lrp/AsnC family transcriptional regulator [Lentilitoribacter sp. Alg239-R112]
MFDAVKIDEMDRRIITLLKHDSRIPITSIAKTLLISRLTVKARIDKLLKSGAIQKFTVQVATMAEANIVHAITNIEVQGLKSELVQRHLRKIPEVISLYTTNGKWGLVAQTETSDLQHFDEVLFKIDKIPGIVSAETCILLNKVV